MEIATSLICLVQYSHDEVVIHNIFLNGWNLPQVLEIYKGRLSEDKIVAIARRFLIEYGSKRGKEDDSGFKRNLGKWQNQQK